MSNTSVIVESFQVDEETSGRYTCDFVDEDEIPIPLAQMDDLVFTLYDVTSGDVINGRDQQDVLNVNGATFHATTGRFTWFWDPEDMEIQDAALPSEIHRGLLEWSWASGAKQNKHEVEFIVRNLRMVSDPP